LRRAIQSQLEDKLAEQMLEGNVVSGDVTATVRDGKIIFLTPSKPDIKPAESAKV
jgi:ATP-dependent Clp protease ATP-binding subunit ClpA